MQEWEKIGIKRIGPAAKKYLASKSSKHGTSKCKIKGIRCDNGIIKCNDGNIKCKSGVIKCGDGVIKCDNRTIRWVQTLMDDAQANPSHATDNAITLFSKLEEVGGLRGISWIMKNVNKL